VKYVNQRLADLLGYSINEILNWKPGEFFKTIPSNMKKKIFHLVKILKNDPLKPFISYQSQGIKKNSTKIWLNIYLKSILYLGEFAYLATFIDITDQKKVEKKLKESEERYRHLFESSPYAIILADSSGDIIDCNTSCKQLFSALIKEECTKRNFNMIFSKLINSEEAFSIFKKKYHNILKGDIFEPFHIELIKPDGIKCWLNFQASLLNIGNNTLIQIIVQDITDKKEAERVIREENEKLLELNQMKNELVSRVSHELKTPLNSMYGAAQVLVNLYKDQVSNNAFEFIEMINRGGEKLKLLIENLLDISRLESGKLELDIRKENLVEIIEENVENIRYMANQRNLAVNLELPVELYIDLDKIRIEQVLMNLLSNAIKNTPPGGSINIVLSDDNKWTDIYIKDTGIGFTEKEKNGNLFKKFGKIERYGKKLDVDIEGSGLGLYISKEIVDLHGGKNWVESEGRNKGSTFIIRLFKK
jgi:PAS domain S-box-containing protein